MRKFYTVTFTILSLLITTSTFGQGLGVGYRNTDKQADELSYANPREYEIADIRISGLKTLNENALISISGLKVGDKIRIPGEETSNAIRKLWKNGIIGNVSINIEKIENGKVWIVIELSERPRLTRIVLEGVNKTQQTEIKDDLELIRGKVLSDAIVKNAEITVKKYFVEKGFLNADVKMSREPDSLITNGVRLKINIDKKSKVRVNEIFYDGNVAYTDSKLRGKMKKTGTKVKLNLFKDLFYGLTRSKPKDWANFFTHSHEVSSSDIREYMGSKVNLNFFKSPKLVREEYKNDKKGLITYYNGKGFRNARILSDSIYYVDENEINIKIKIEEGRKFYFRDVIWSGNYLYTDEYLDRILGVTKGDIYDMELIQKKLQFNPNGQDISSLYMDYGYLFFSVTPVEVRIDEDSIDVEMRIYEGEQATINKVIVTGNDRTSDHVVMREIRTLPGDKFSRSELIRTQRELSQLGYFDPETMNIVPMPNQADGTVDILYELEEKPNDQVELSGGWGGFYGFVGSVGLTFNNFSLRNITRPEYWRPLPVGDGQRLSLRVQANGRFFQNYSLTFTEPWLGGKKPNALSFSINRSVSRNQPIPGQEDGVLKLTNFTLGLGKRLRWPDDFFSINASLGYTYYQFDNFTSTTTNSELGFTTGDANNIQFNLVLSRNSINQPMYPTSGSSWSLGVSLTPPYSAFNDIDYANSPNEVKFKWVEYHKWMFDFRYYQALVGKLVFHARAHIGLMKTYNSNAELGPFDRFQLGGDGLAGNNFILGYDVIGLRGYQNNEITPPGYSGASQGGEIRGGTVYNKYVMELRYPITTGQAATIYVLGFLEGGNNWYTSGEYNPFNMYRSAGFGARIFMPAFGLLGIDWGYGFDKVPGANQVSGAQFHFSIGQQIR